MLDGHIHIEKQPYSLELIENMVQTAISKGIDELNILDHTHKFTEFAFLYSTLKGEGTIAWYAKKKTISIAEYIDFIKLVKSKVWPIKLNFGLEVCYFPEHREELKEELKKYDCFDFVIGSIHFVDGVGIDLNKDFLIGLDYDAYYKRYFEELDDIIESQIFDVIAHLDSIKLFDIFPSFDLKPYYEHLAQTLKKFNQRTENNSGLTRYGYPYPGMHPDLINALLKYDVKFHKSSDAHKYEDIGRRFDELISNL